MAGMGVNGLEMPDYCPALYCKIRTAKGTNQNSPFHCRPVQPQRLNWPISLHFETNIMRARTDWFKIMLWSINQLDYELKISA